jgi:hypothetical protein
VHGGTVLLSRSTAASRACMEIKLLLNITIDQKNHHY